jgi:hypothetical protein
MSCEPVSRVIPAGLAKAVAPSAAREAMPALAVPTSGVPISYNHSPAASAEIACTMSVSAVNALANFLDMDL